MLKKTVHIVVVSCLSLLLLFGASAKEFVHLFAHHEDTVHNLEHVCPPGETHLEQEHHHCSFLSFLLEPFANDASIPCIYFIPSIEFVNKHSVVHAKFIPRNLDQIALRGPPAVAA